MVCMTQANNGASFTTHGDHGEPEEASPKDNETCQEPNQNHRSNTDTES